MLSSPQVRPGHQRCRKDFTVRFAAWNPEAVGRKKPLESKLINGSSWIPMDFTGFLSMNTNEYQWISMNINEYQWISMNHDEIDYLSIQNGIVSRRRCCFRPHGSGHRMSVMVKCWVNELHPAMDSRIQTHPHKKKRALKVIHCLRSAINPASCRQTCKASPAVRSDPPGHNDSPEDLLPSSVASFRHWQSSSPPTNHCSSLPSLPSCAALLRSGSSALLPPSRPLQPSSPAREAPSIASSFGLVSFNNSWKAFLSPVSSKTFASSRAQHHLAVAKSVTRTAAMARSTWAVAQGGPRATRCFESQD